jgi:hypothetical protein
LQPNCGIGIPLSLRGRGDCRAARVEGLSEERGMLLKVLKIVNNPFLPGMNFKSLS